MIQQQALHFNKNIKFNFNGGDLTNDAGLFLIREFMDKMDFKSLLTHYLSIKNDGAIRKHTNLDLCLQQIFQSIAGYHCANHADEIKLDPVLTTLLDKPILASQPTLSRFNHRLTHETAKQFEKVNEQLLDRYYRLSPPTQMIFDIDSTHFQSYGRQYGNSFNGHYQEQGFHPLMVFDGLTGDCLKAELRAGRVYTSRKVVSFLGPLLSRYRKKFKMIPRIVRGDSGFAHKELYSLCETLDTHYVIRLKANRTLYQKASEWTQQVMKEEKVSQSQQVYGEFEYQAGSWNKPRRVIVEVKRKAGEMYPQVMFIVTNTDLSPEETVEFYTKRGTMENYIKECKHGFRMDKVSHRSFITNVNRMMQILLAYNLVNGFKRLTLPKEVRQMTIDTLRLKLFKVAAKKVKTARQVIFKLCSHCPYKTIFYETIQTIQAIQLE